MRYIYLLFLVFGYSFALNAQVSLQFTVNQLPLLEVDAGKDTTVNKGSQIKIGGIAPAMGGSGIYVYSWSPATGLDRSDIGNPTATVDSTITYTLSVNDGTGCIKTSQVTLRTTVSTSIDPVALTVGFNLFPNPTKGTFYIRTEHIVTERTLQIELFDIQGEKVFVETISGYRRLNYTIRLETSSRGLYILKLTGSKLHIIQKVLVQ